MRTWLLTAIDRTATMCSSIDRASQSAQLPIATADTGRLVAAAADDAACVEDEVGRVKNAARFDRFGIPFGAQLIVRRAGDDGRLQVRDGLFVEDSAQRAGRKDIRRCVIDRVGRNGDGGTGARARPTSVARLARCC